MIVYDLICFKVLMNSNVRKLKKKKNIIKCCLLILLTMLLQGFHVMLNYGNYELIEN